MALSLDEWYKKKKNEEKELASLDEWYGKKTGKVSETKKSSLFQAGAFEDGYQFGDVARTILGTVNDVSENVTTAVLDATENLIDTAAYGIGWATRLFDKSGKAQDDIGKFIGSDFLKVKESGEAINRIFNPLGTASAIINGEDTEKYSVLGDKADGLVQSGAHLIGSKALGAINPALSYISMAVNAFGSEIEQAYQNDATHAEAGISGAISAGAEILFEKLSSGIKILKGTTLDESATRWLSTNLSKKIGRTMLKMGMDLTAEGAEEVATEAASALGRKITYADEKQWEELFSSEDALDAFLGGVIMSGFAGGGKLVNSYRNGVDYTSGLTASEEKVVNKLYEDAIAKEQSDGKKLSSKRKDSIYNEIVENMQKGHISTDIIEETLGGETYRAYKDAVDNEKSLKEEYDELRRMKKGEMNDIQQDRLAELKEMNLEDSTKSRQLRAKLDSEMSKFVKNSRLAESYRENVRRGQAFESDLNQYQDEYSKKTIKNIMDSKIANNTNLTHEFADMLARMSADQKTVFDFTDNEKLKNSIFGVDGKSVNGYITKDGITINLNSPKTLQTIVGHEISHVLEGTELYSSLQSELKNYLGDAEYSKRLVAIKETYKDIYTGEDADTKFEQELTADLVGDLLFTDKNFVSRLYSGNRNLFQKIFDEIKYLCRVATAGSKQARQLEKIRHTFEEVYKEGAKAQKNTATEDGDNSTGIRFSLDFNDYPYDMQTVIKEYLNSSDLKLVGFINDARAETNKKRLEYMHFDFKNDINIKALNDANRILGFDISGYKIQVNGESIHHIDKRHGKNGKHDQTMKNDLDIARAQYIITNADFVQQAIDSRGEKAVDSQYRDKNNNPSKVLLFAKKVNGTYCVTLAAPDSNKRTLHIKSMYFAKKIEEIQEFDANSLEPTSKTNLEISSNNSISNPDENVNGKLSLFSKNEDIAPVKDGIYGKDIALQKASNQDLAPVRTDIPKTAKKASDGILAPTKDDIEAMEKAKRKIVAPTRDDIKENRDKVAEVLTDEPKTKKKKGQDFMRAFMQFRSSFLDKGSVFEDLSLKTKNRELMAKWNSTLSSDTKAQRLIGNGADGVKALNNIRKSVEDMGKTKEFYEYMYHLHNVDRMSLEAKESANLKRLEGEMKKLKLLHLQENQLRAIASEKITKDTSPKRVELLKTVREYLASKDIKNKPVFGSGVTAQESRSMVQQYEKQYPQFKKLSQDVYGYLNHLRNLMVDKGVISQETADLWAEMYPHYVPIRRAGDKGLNISVPLDTGRTGVNAPVKAATGGNSDILPLFDTIAQRTVQTYKAVDRNSFGIELKNTLGSSIATEAASVDDVIDSVDTHEELLKAGKNDRSPTFTVFENGKRVTFEINEDMYDALKPASSRLSGTSKILSTANNIRRGLLTEYNPTFMVTNPIKDVQDVLINSQHPARTYVSMPEAAKELWQKGGKWYKEYMENGGEQNTYFDKQSNTFDKEKSALRKALGFPLDKISEANNFIERIPRLAEYIASRKSGASIDVAMLDAARVTTNFAAGGDVTKFLNRNGFTFLNASVQGFNQQIRNIREAKRNGLKGVMALAAKVTLAGLPALLLNSLLWDDDEDYEELSDYVKDNYYIVAKYGDGNFVRIPKGRAAAVIQDAFEQVSNTLTGDDEADWQNFGELLISNLAPNNPLDNNLIAPIVQALENKTWYGEDLVPSRLQDLPEAEQYDESTDAISKWLGETTNISPYKWNYLLDQYSGGLGDVVLPMLTPEAESGDNSFLGNVLAPMKDKFTTDSVMNNQNVSDFYDTMDELTTNSKSSAATDEDILKNKYFNSVNSDLSDLYKQKREIQNSSLPDESKYMQVRTLQKQIDEMAKKALGSYNQVSIYGDYATVADQHYKLNDEGEWKKLSDSQVKKLETFGKAVGGNAAYISYTRDLSNIKSDKDRSGNAISGSRKKKVVQYINSLDADYGEKLILYKSQYTGDDTYNYEIVEYLNSRDDLSYTEMKTILEELGFTVLSDGRVRW